jgi:hypothetical protein
MSRTVGADGREKKSGSLFETRAAPTGASRELDVTFAKFLKHERLRGTGLFAGFETMRAITYSSSAGFIRDLFGELREIEVIFGSDVSVTGDIARLMAAQQAGLEAIRGEFGRAGKQLADLLEQKRLRLLYARYTVHRKMFLLEGDGRRRVILGSANLSLSAFGGLQGEHLVVFDDDLGMYEQALHIYEEQLKDSDPILPNILHKTGAVEIDELPAFQKVVHSRDAFVLEPGKLGTPGSTVSDSDPSVCVIKTEDYKRHFANALPPLVGKPVLLTTDHIRKATEQARQSKLIRSVEKREIPHLEADLDRGEVRLNGKTLDLFPPDAEVIADARALDEFMRGYKQYFHGKVVELVQDYNAFMTWLFATPLICLARTAALQNDFNVLRYPACGVLYGKSNAGKTDLTRVLLRAMFEQEWWLDVKDFNSTNFYAAAERGGSFPVVVDDISSDKFRDPAKALIKRDHQMGLFPVLVLSTNQDVRAVEPDVLKRAVVVHADASVPIAMSAANNFVARVNRRLGTALYRRFLGRMLASWPNFMSEFHAQPVTGHAAEIGGADLVGLSSATLRAVLDEALGSIPDWCEAVDVNTLVGMNGRKIKDRMRTHWEYQRRSFEVARNTNRLILTLSEVRDRNDFRKDLPSHVFCDATQDKVILWLDKAEEYFGIEFSHRGLRYLIPWWFRSNRV